MNLFRPVSYVIDRLFIVCGAFVGSQIPAFMSQYTQHLRGHVDELNHLLGQLTKVAAQSGKTLDVYIQKFLVSSDSDIVAQGEFIQEIISRTHHLSGMLKELNESTLWTRPYVFLKNLNYDIVQSTYYHYQPSLNFNLEGLCYIGLGVLVGFVTFKLLAKCMKLMLKPFQIKKLNPTCHP